MPVARIDRVSATLHYPPAELPVPCVRGTLKRCREALPLPHAIAKQELTVQLTLVINLHVHFPGEANAAMQLG